MMIHDLENKKVAVLGLGVEGIALVSFLMDKVLDISIFDRSSEDILIENSPKDQRDDLLRILSNPRIKKVFGENYFDEINGFDIVFRSPSIYFNHKKIQEMKESGTQVSSQMRLFFDLCPCKIIGVTGTKGKGTTSSLIYEILKKHFDSLVSDSHKQGSTTVYLAGNIGYPAITLIPKLKSSDIVVLELSNFQLADLHKSPNVAVVTNLGVDHLDYHKDIIEYHKAKESILKYQDSGDYAVLNSNSSFEEGFLSGIKSVVFYFSGNDKKDGLKSVVRETGEGFGVFLARGDGREEVICLDKEIKLVGRHNLENVAAASIVADIFGVYTTTIRESVKNFEGLPYRIEFVTKINGVAYINDSFATNPGPTIAAIKSFDNDKILILGGSSKGSDFHEMAKLIAESNVKAALLIGVEGKKIKESLVNAQYRGLVEDGFSDLPGVVAKADEISQAGDVVIFSPACASFDMFKNYKVRGEKFKAAVLKYKDQLVINEQIMGKANE